MRNCEPTIIEGTPGIIINLMNNLSQGLIKENQLGQYCCPRCNPHIICNANIFNMLIMSWQGNIPRCIRAYPLTLEESIAELTQLCSTNFTTQIDVLLNMLTAQQVEALDAIGIIEHSFIKQDESEIGKIIDFFISLNLTSDELWYSLQTILENGIVTWCDNGQVIIGTVCFYSFYTQQQQPQ